MGKSNQGGVGFVGLLFITFLVLKLTGFIAWSWWWITAPLWIPFALGVIIFIWSVVRVIRTARRNNMKYNR